MAVVSAFRQEWSLDTALGTTPKATEFYSVSGLTGAPASMILEALGAAGIPRLGDEHSIISGIGATSVVATGIEGGIVEVRAEYGVPELTASVSNPPVHRVGGRIQTTTTTKSYNGLDLTAIHFPGGVAPLVTRIVEVEIGIPQVVFSFERDEPESPGDKARNFVGKVNSVPIFNDGPRKWLCTAIEGISNDNGLTWHVSYEFERSHRSIGWDVKVFVIDRDTGDPLPGQTGTNYQVYEAVPFQSLGI